MAEANYFYNYPGSSSSVYVAKELVKMGFKPVPNLKKHQQLFRESDRGAYSVLLEKGVIFFWIKKRSKYCFETHEKMWKQGQRIYVNHIAGEWLLTQKNQLVRMLYTHYGCRNVADLHPKTYILTPNMNQLPWVHHNIANTHKKGLMALFSNHLSVRGAMEAIIHEVQIYRKYYRQRDLLYRSKRSAIATVPAESCTTRGHEEEQAVPVNKGYYRPIKSWILKPAQSARGKDIHVVDTPSRILSHLMDDELHISYDDDEGFIINGVSDRQVSEDAIRDECRTFRARVSEIINTYLERQYTHVIFQKYMDRPMLIDNRKFDMRVYLFVASIKPMLAFFCPGFIRLCGSDYNLDNVSDRTAHITNYNVGKTHENYDPDSDTINDVKIRRTFPETTAYFEERETVMPVQVSEEEEAYFESKGMNHWLYYRISEALRRIVIASHDKFLVTKGSGDGQYCMIGADLMLDVDGRASIIEFSVGPSIRMKPKWLEELHKPLLADTVKTVAHIERLKKESLPNPLQSDHPALKEIGRDSWTWLCKRDSLEPLTYTA